MLERPVMLITGTRTGIGRYLAEYYVDKGYEVAGCSRGAADWELPHYHHFTLDVSDEDAVKKMLLDVRKGFGRLDVLLNNAGIASMNHMLLTPVQTVKTIFDTNALGTFLLCRESARIMQRRSYGRIVNFVSVAVPWDLEGEAVYAGSKAAIGSFTRVFARELAESGITVNAVGPTPIETDLIRGVPKEKIEQLLARQAIHRMGQMTDVSNVIDFFICPRSDFITGQIVYLGGA